MQTLQYKNIDLLEMPLDGIATYWLSLKKLLELKKNQSIIQEEIKSIDEHFTKYLLEITFASTLQTEQIRSFAKTYKKTFLRQIETNIILMRYTLLSIRKSEHPRLLLVRLLPFFPALTMTEEALFSYATSMANDLYQNKENMQQHLGMHHKLRPEQLLVKLLCYSIYAKKEGLTSLEPFTSVKESIPFWNQGLTLIVEKFDIETLITDLQVMQENLLWQVKQKTNMSIELCLCVNTRLSYGDMLLIAKSYLGK